MGKEDAFKFIVASFTSELRRDEEELGRLEKVPGFKSQADVEDLRKSIEERRAKLAELEAA